MKGFISTVLMATILAGCSQSAETDTAASTTKKTTDADDVTEVNALATAYPGSLALSVFPSEAASALKLADEVKDEAGLDRPPEEKKKEAEERMKGEGDCFDVNQLGEFKARFSQLKCYEFDSDMEPFRMANESADSFGTMNGLDGVTGSTQACLVTFTKSEVDEVVHIVDRSLAMVQGLICVEKKLADAEARDVRTPTVGSAAISLTDDINGKLPAKSPISFTQADISAETNPDGGITYITEISVKNPFGKADSIVLRHTPATETVTSESGILSFVREPLGAATPGNNPPNDPNATKDKYSVLTIKYSKSNDGTNDNMKAELTRAMINKSYSPLDADGLINFAGIPKTAQNSDIHAIKYVSFDIIPTTGEGSLSYWMNPGGNFVESARGMVFNLTADASTGLLTGCGTTGATSDISIRAAVADSSKTLAPTRYWHPRANLNVSPNKDSRYTASEGNMVTQQCVKQNTAGSYDIDTSKTVHARGYDVIAGTDSKVRAPQRPPEPNLPPPPPKK